jgi:hypothetical protein
LAANYPPLEVARHEPVPDFPANQVVLFADEHFGSGGREGLADALNALCGKSPLIIDAAAQGLDSAALKGVDLLVLYHTQEHADEATQQLLKDWVGRKMPLLLVHAALGAYPKWDEYQKWIGRAWIWGDSEHPHQDSEILVHDSLDRGPGWKSAWLPRDEVFIKLGLTSSVDDLLSVRSSSGIYPAGWVNHSQRNIGVFVPGHLGDMWGLPVIRQALAAIVRQISKSPTSVRT